MSPLPQNDKMLEIYTQLHNYIFCHKIKHYKTQKRVYVHYYICCSIHST